MHAQFDIKALFQTRGIVPNYTDVRTENLDYIILELARSVAWFASRGNLKNLFGILSRFALLWLLYSPASPRKFALGDIVTDMPRRDAQTREKNKRRKGKRIQLASEHTSSKSSCCIVSSSSRYIHSFHDHRTDHDRVAGHANLSPGILLD